MNGLTNQISKAEPIIGFTDRETVMLDLDEMKFKKVKYWALKVCEHFWQNGFIVLKSSENNYHVVFDCYGSREENLAVVVAWVAILSRSILMLRYLAMQCIKMSSTLRVSSKGNKPAPRIGYRFGSQDHAIKDFLGYRQLTKRIHRI